MMNEPDPETVRMVLDHTRMMDGYSKLMEKQIARQRFTMVLLAVCTVINLVLLAIYIWGYDAGVPDGTAALPGGLPWNC